MDFLMLALRLANKNGAVYPPYYFVEDAATERFTDDERAAIAAVLDPHVPEKVDAMFNEWSFTKYHNGYNVRRSTWDTSEYRRTLGEVVTLLQEYYDR